jgi:hypothetical protein
LFFNDESDEIGLISRFLMGDKDITEEDKTFLQEAVASCFISFIKGKCSFEKVQTASGMVFETLQTYNVNHGEMIALFLFFLDVLISDLKREMNKDKDDDPILDVDLNLVLKSILDSLDEENEEE